MRDKYTNALGQTWWLYQDVFDPRDERCEIVEFILSASEPTEMFAKVEYPDMLTPMKIFNVGLLLDAE